MLNTIAQSFKARWYQDESVQSLFDYFYNGGKGNPLVIAPTGAGKSHILGMFCRAVLERWPEQRILILTHVDTIIEQDHDAVCLHVPARKVGIYSAGAGRKERRAVTVAGIQSIHKKASLFKNTTLILIDEAHTVPPKGEGMYRSFLANFDCPIIGLTATHFRLGTGYLHEGSGRIFTDIAYTIDIEKLIEEGYLCNLIPKAPLENIDMDGVHTQGGEFVKKEMRERVNEAGLTEKIVNELVKYKGGYNRWLIFAIDIEHAENIVIMLRILGVSCDLVHSKQSKATNRSVKQRYKAGEFDALVSVESLTTGFDEPRIDLIALMRPTKSPVLHIQMIGRGLRIHPDKDHCLVLDFAGNVQRLGPINDVQIAKPKKKKKGDPITKVCPECKTICAGSVRICPTCGFEFEFKSKLEDQAATKAIIKTKQPPPPPIWYDVNKVAYSPHKSKAGNHTVLVSYQCGLRTFFEYQAFDPDNKMSYAGRRWWKNRLITGQKWIPGTTQHALEFADQILRKPKRILIDENGKYPLIKRVDLGD